MSDDLERVYQVIGENLDRLCSLELRPRGYSHGVIHPLYQAAREKIGQPLSLDAARRLHEAVKPGDVVILTTGAPIPRFMPNGETDGPLGVTALARLLAEGLGAIPVLLTETSCIEALAATAVGTGLGIRPVAEARSVPASVVVLDFPADESAAKAAATRLLDELRPAAVVAIEKLGPNHVGVAHSATGMPASPERARIEELIEQAQTRGVVTIGVGDNGNEIGFGLIQEAVWEHKPFGRVCQCPCGEGMATSVATDSLVVAGTSNWGAYAIEACLAALIGRPDLIHSARTEAFMIEQCVRAGGVDGSTARQTLMVDGTSLETQLALNELFRAVVQHGLAPVRTRPF